jgi:hypothetical protein
VEQQSIRRIHATPEDEENPDGKINEKPVIQQYSKEPVSFAISFVTQYKRRYR